MNTSDRERKELHWVVVLCLIGLALRVPGLFSDLWLDEIWGLNLAVGVKRFGHIFTRIHFDTNHWLYSVYLRACGDNASAWLYRIPSLVAGVALLPLMALAGRRSGQGRSGLWAMALGVASFLLCVYSSEARGYALCLLCGMTAFLLMGNWMERPRLPLVPGFAIVCALGILSHLTFVFIYVSLGVWSLTALWRPEPVSRAKRILGLMAAHALPVCAFAVLYWLDIRHIYHGGASENSLLSVIAGLLTTTAGWALSPPLGWLTPLLVGVASIAALVLGAYRRQRAWVFFVSVLFVMPAAFVLVKRSSFTYWQDRHFLVCVPFILLLCGDLLQRAWRGNIAWRACAGILVALCIAGNGLRLMQFFQYGRGGYRAAVEFMARNTGGTVVKVSGDHDFRNAMVLQYHARAVPDRRYVFFRGGTSAPADWYLAHSATSWKPMETVETASGRRYRLASFFPYAGVSGWNWAVYRREKP